MIPDFLWLTLIAGIAIAAISGPLGSLVVWRGMAYFGDTLAHSALLGVAIGLLINIPLTLAIVIICFSIATGLLILQRQSQLPTDTLLGILSHTMLALGLVVISLMDTRIDLNNYLFGDILTLNTTEVIIIVCVVLLVAALLIWQWQALIMITLNEELAQASGIPVQKIRLLLMLIIAMTIAISIRAVGVLLITSLLIIPAATARHLSRTPEYMALSASIIAIIAVLLGLASSFWFNIPTGPAIVLALACQFLIASLMYRK